jgi:hypothetical protein
MIKRHSTPHSLSPSRLVQLHVVQLARLLNVILGRGTSLENHHRHLLKLGPRLRGPGTALDLS